MPHFRFDVFLSHSSADKARVRVLAQRLRAAGLRVWFDDWSIQPGDDIYLAIEHGLESSRVQVLCLSEAAMDSDWVTLERSTVLFRDPCNIGRRLLPILLTDCIIPDTLRRYKYVDYRKETRADFREVLAACRDTASTEVTSRHSSGPGAQFGRADFKRLSARYGSSSIDNDPRRKNLATGDWRYDTLFLPPLRERGWVRFAAGFKAGIYGHARHRGVSKCWEWV